MPMYTHKCLKCGETTDVLRKLEDYHVPPTKEECPNGCPSCGDPNPEWEKTLNVSTKRWRFCDTKG